MADVVHNFQKAPSGPVERGVMERTNRLLTDYSNTPSLHSPVGCAGGNSLVPLAVLRNFPRSCPIANLAV
jgi:hypothetical protein